MDVRARIDEIGHRLMGRDWWARVVDELTAEFEPVVAERDRLAEENAQLRRLLDTPAGWAAVAAGAAAAIVSGEVQEYAAARAALDRETP